MIFNIELAIFAILLITLVLITAFVSKETFYVCRRGSGGCERNLYQPRCPFVGPATIYPITGKLYQNPYPSIVVEEGRGQIFEK